MKLFPTKAMSVAACGVMTVAALSGMSTLKQTVNAASYYTPRLIVTGSEVDAERVNAGDEFDLTVHFMNESEDTHLYNIKIAFTSPDNVIYPAEGTNVHYISSVEDEEEFDVTIMRSSVRHNNWLQPALFEPQFPVPAGSESV